MRHLLALILTTAALPLLASCSATVAPDDGYGYYDNTPTYYGNAYPNYYYSPYPRYHEYRDYHPYYHRPYVYHHDDDDRRHALNERYEHEHGIHGQITVER